MLTVSTANTVGESAPSDTLTENNRPYTGIVNDTNGYETFAKQYVNGYQHGVQKTYYQSGQIKEVTMFTLGVENGRCIHYYEDGSKKMNANYYQGKLEGLYEEWTPCGRIKSRKSFYRGKLVAVTSSLSI
jgi:antitoxin component YwqK of YwqJK toxin-antitoxin module